MSPTSQPVVVAPSPTTPQRVKPKVGKNILIVLSVIVLVFALIAVVLLTLVAKSGFLRVPVLSALYRGPVPTRTISVKPVSFEAFQGTLESRIAKQMSSMRPPYVVRVSEGELTGLLQTAIDSGLRDQEWKRVDAQIVVRASDVEFYSRYVRGAMHMDSIIRFIPRVSDGRLQLQPVSVQIGDFSLPPDFAIRVIGQLFARDFGTWTLSFGSVTLQDVRLTDGAVDIVVAAQKS